MTMAPKTTPGMLANIWVLSCKYLLVAVSGAGNGSLPEKGLQERRELRRRRAHGSSRLGSTGMSHDGDTWSPWRWGLEGGFPKGAPDGGVTPGLMGICLRSYPSKHVCFGRPHAQGAACPPRAPKSCTAPRVSPAAPEGPRFTLSPAMSHPRQTHLHMSTGGAPTWDGFAEAAIPAGNQ